jgi:preprotein translocase subunit SecD
MSSPVFEEGNPLINSFIGSMTYDYSNDYSMSSDPRHRNIRGLRALSLQVKALVAVLGETTYKDVADRLTKEVNDKLAIDPNSELKGDEQNVKRRVYDALNVLIATDVLRKEGKKVYCNTQAELVGIPRRRELTIQKERKKKINEEKKRVIQEKLRVVREMVLKYLAIENLIERNKAAEEEAEEKGDEEEETASEENSTTTTIKELGVKTPQNLKKSSAIHFPFLVVKGSSTPSVMNLFMNNSKKIASIQSKSQLNIFGDTDVLFKLKLHYVSKELFNKVLPQEVHKFIPAAYLDELK